LAQQSTVVNDTWGSSATEDSSDDNHTPVKSPQPKPSINKKTSTATSTALSAIGATSTASANLKQTAVSLDFDYGAAGSLSDTGSGDEEDIDEGDDLFENGSEDLEALLDGLENIESKKAI